MSKLTIIDAETLLANSLSILEAIVSELHTDSIFTKESVLNAHLRHENLCEVVQQCRQSHEVELDEVQSQMIDDFAEDVERLVATIESLGAFYLGDNDKD